MKVMRIELVTSITASPTDPAPEDVRRLVILVPAETDAAKLHEIVRASARHLANGDAMEMPADAYVH